MKQLTVNHAFALCTGIILFFGIGPFVQAGFINGDFETGDFSGWSVLGAPTSSFIETSAFGTGPIGGTYSALLTNTGSVPDSPTDAEIETFLGLLAGALDGRVAGKSGDAHSGTAMKQTFDAIAGDTFFFDYVFLTNDLRDLGFNQAVDSNDFAFISIVGTPTGLGTGVGNLTDTSLPLIMSSTIFSFETQPNSFGLILPFDATYTLGIGVIDSFDDGVDSAILIDNVRVRMASAVIPEPSSIVLFGLGAVAILAYGWRRKRKQAA